MSTQTPIFKNCIPICNQLSCGGFDSCYGICNIKRIDKNNNLILKSESNDLIWKVSGTNFSYNYSINILQNQITPEPDSNLSNNIIFFIPKDAGPTLQAQVNNDGTFLIIKNGGSIIQPDTILLLDENTNIFETLDNSITILPINCSDKCLTFINDDANCGFCGNQCSQDTKCCGRKCIPISGTDTCAEHDCNKICGTNEINCGGECLSRDRVYDDCTCKGNWEGDNCNICPKNFDNSDGTCTKCPAGFKGDNCQYSDKDTCSGHGMVDENGNCTCQGNWTLQPGLGHIKPAQCALCPPNFDNSDGTCTKCPLGYVGSSCQYSDTTTCSGNGTVDPNTGICTCKGKWATRDASTGQCNYCPTPYTGANCCETGFKGDKCQYSDKTTCNGNGTVDDNGKCTCKPGYSGDNCQLCRFKKEVFATEGYFFTREQAPSVCQQYGAELATYQQLTDAQKAGAQWCFGGIVKDAPSELPYPFPSQTGTDGGCGAGTPMKSWSVDGKAVAVCYGFKPNEGDKRDITVVNQDGTKNTIKGVNICAFNQGNGTQKQGSAKYSQYNETPVNCNSCKNEYKKVLGKFTCPTGYYMKDGMKEVRGDWECGQRCPGGLTDTGCGCACLEIPKNCQDMMCVGGCPPNSVCLEGKCVCFSGYTGDKCQYDRITTCNGKGNPDYNGNCNCDGPYSGTHCEITCNGRGSLTKDEHGQTICNCNTGYAGINCQHSREITCEGKGDPTAGGMCIMDCEQTNTDKQCCHGFGANCEDGDPSCNSHWSCPDQGPYEYPWAYTGMHDCDSSAAGCFWGYQCKQGYCQRPKSLSEHNINKIAGHKCNPTYGFPQYPRYSAPGVDYNKPNGPIGITRAC